MQNAQAPQYPTQLIIVRHGESEMNVRKAIAMAKGNVEHITLEPIRDADVILTEKGRDQADKTGIGLRTHTEHIDVAYVSPFIRTMDTFRHILDSIGYDIPLKQEDRLREREFGIFSQMTMYGIEKHYPQEAHRLKLEGDYYYRPLGGESYPDMGLRLHSFLHSLYQHQPGKRVLIVTHADVVQMLRKLLEKFDEAQLLELNRSDDVLNCGVTSYYFDPTTDYLKLHRYNQTFY
jgi:broad specificity phosphatase PhoE